jgi:hypothetical protein
MFEQAQEDISMEDVLGGPLNPRPALQYEARPETEEEKNECQCGWCDCNGPHGAGDSCYCPASGTWTAPDGKKFNLCFGCYEAGDRGRPLPANEWIEFENNDISMEEALGGPVAEFDWSTGKSRIEMRREAMAKLAYGIQEALDARYLLADDDNYPPVMAFEDELTKMADSIAKNLFVNAAHDHHRRVRQ